MKRLIPACAIAVALGTSAAAQDSTVKTKTKVDADDAHTVVMRGCLMQAGPIFTLAGATATGGDDLEIRSKVKTDVDRDDTEVKSKTTAKIENDDHGAVGTSGAVMAYELAPRAGVDLAAHVGHEVEISGVMLDAAKGDDDADVKISEKTKVKTEDAPDAKVETKTKAELPRGAHARLAVVSVSPVGSSCGSN
jgi:hypothetical protein